MREKLLEIFWQIPLLRSFARERMPVHGRGYKHYWQSEDGRAYREKTYERQRRDGEQPLLDNPSFLEIRKALNAHVPQAVLEVGCGWGRILEELDPDYDIQGCDIAEDLLAQAAPHLRTFVLDIADPDPKWLASHENVWDVTFTRAVMMYFLRQPEEMRKAMDTLETITSSKVIIWEWPHVCEAMRKISSSDKFEYRPLSLRKE